MSALDKALEDEGWISGEELEQARAELAQLRSLAARAEANERDAERWRKVVELMDNFTTTWTDGVPTFEQSRAQRDQLLAVIVDQYRLVKTENTP
jgi:hypothetical protein